MALSKRALAHHTKGPHSGLEHKPVVLPAKEPHLVLARSKEVHDDHFCDGRRRSTALCFLGRIQRYLCFRRQHQKWPEKALTAVLYSSIALGASPHNMLQDELAAAPDIIVADRSKPSQVASSTKCVRHRWAARCFLAEHAANALLASWLPCMSAQCVRLC